MSHLRSGTVRNRPAPHNGLNRRFLVEGNATIIVNVFERSLDDGSGCPGTDEMIDGDVRPKCVASHAGHRDGSVGMHSCESAEDLASSSVTGDQDLTRWVHLKRDGVLRRDNGGDPMIKGIKSHDFSSCDVP
jgi:hypothetical protein